MVERTADQRIRTTEWEEVQYKFGNRVGKYATNEIELLAQKIADNNLDAPLKVYDPQEEKVVDKMERGGYEVEGIVSEPAVGDVLPDDDDEALAAFRKKRLAQLQQQKERERFGVLRHVSGADYMTEVTEASCSCWVVAMLMKPGHDNCEALLSVLRAAAQRHRDVKFVSMISTEAVKSFPDRHLPCVLFYKNKKLENQLTELTPWKGKQSGISLESVERVLHRYGVIREADYDTDEEKQPISFFILLCGQAGCGKSTTLQAISDGAAAYGMSVTYGPPTLGESVAVTDWTAEKAKLYVMDFNILRSLDLQRPPASYVYPPGTVVVLDDVESVYRLMHLQGISHRLQLFLRLLIDSPHSALITSATEASRVPQWLVDMRTPILYQIPELSASSVRRHICTLPEAGAYASCAVEGCGEILASRLRTLRDLTLHLCCTRFRGESSHPFSSNVLQFPGRLCSPLPVCGELFGLDTIIKRMDALVRHFIERDESSVNGLLSAAASVTGILLHGPSGTGKTALAMRYRAIYSERFLSVNCAALFSKYLGESEQRLREAFAQARARAPSILFLDGVEVIGSARGSMSSNNKGEGVDVSRRMLAALLCELDGITDSGRVLVIGATTVPDKLDSALLRQGRFEVLQYVPPLSYDASRGMALNFFERFSDAALNKERVESLAALVATRARGSTPASLRAFLRVLLEKHLESWDENHLGGSAPPLPSTALVKETLGGSNQLTCVHYAYATL